jgi:hypothetical protein
MRLKAISTLALVALVTGALLAPGIADAKKKKKKNPTGPLVVGTDAAGDWGAAVDPTIGPIGDALGQDLIEATLEMADKETVNFIIKLNSLPPAGGAPEVSRYTWDFMVDGEFTELDGKFTNYSRGACDPTSGQCPPPRDPGMSPFFIRANCEANEANVTICEETGTVEAVFDAAAGTITIPVPLELINAKHGSKIGPGTNIFGGSISATPAAFVTSSAMPLDTLTVLETFVVSAK